jgi:endonuclease VIII
MLMQGSWTVTAPGRTPPRAVLDLVRVRMRLDDGRTAHAVDMPIVELLPPAGVAELEARLGPDPLRSDWDADEAVRRLASRPDRALVVALLDQRNIAGLGNLWVNELAFLRGVHPFAPVGSVPLEPLVRLAARALTASATLPGQPAGD